MILNKIMQILDHFLHRDQTWLELSLGVRQSINLNSDCSLRLILIGLRQSDALRQFVNLSLQVRKASRHYLFRRFLEIVQLALPSLHMAERFISFDNVKDGRAALVIELSLGPQGFSLLDVLLFLLDETHADEGVIKPVTAEVFLWFHLSGGSSRVSVALVDQVDVVFCDGQFSDTGVVFFVFLSLCESVWHDSNKHVQKDDLNEEGWA